MYNNLLAELIRVDNMFEKLRISLIFINLVLPKSLSLNHRMHNLYTKFVRILEICKQFSHNLVNAARLFHLKEAFIACLYGENP